MGKVLVTGGTGFVGLVLIPKLLARGEHVFALARDVARAKTTLPAEVEIIEGDIVKPGLGVDKLPPGIESVIHSAALLSFQTKDRNKLYETNYQGTINLLDFMRRYKITRLFHVSTSYLFGQNHYEISKQMAEEVIKQYPEIKATVIRPSIIIGDSRLQGLPTLSGFYLGIAAIDAGKRWFEQKTKAWPWRVKIRIKAHEKGSLNLIPIDKVVELIVETVVNEKEGVLYATHPVPATLKSLEKPISDAVGANVKFVGANFKLNPAEKMASVLMKGLVPYLMRSYEFPSDIDCAPLTPEFLTETIKHFLKREGL